MFEPAQESARPHRKSVAFSEGATIVDSSGGVTEVNGHSDQTSAENHTVGELAPGSKFHPVC